jgi:putative ABC transport system ATP-binding protein
VEVIDVIQKLNREKNITVVVVTHEPQVTRYCQRIIRVRDGLVREDVRVDRPGAAAEDLKRMPREVEE